MADFVKIHPGELHDKIYTICCRKLAEKDSEIIARMIVDSERMGVQSHGLHYFLFSILPLIEADQVGKVKLTARGHILNAEGPGGVGFMNMLRCLERASNIAKEQGTCLVVYKNPGKIGALRVYCQKIMDQGQLIVCCKNTAATIGLRQTGRPLIGTNPLCIGLPDSEFIYDSSTSTVATNKVRVAKKMGKMFDNPIGLAENLEPTCDPADILDGDGFLLPFSLEQYWYKSFFLGVAIECISAMAGGKTSIRVGENKGSRLYSDEGMIILLVDQSAFPHYSNYLKEQEMFFQDLAQHHVKIPGKMVLEKEELEILKKDWLEVGAL